MHALLLHRLTTMLGLVRRGAATFEAALVVCCAGLQSDRVAAMDGLTDAEANGVRIVPFRETFYAIARGPAAAPESSGGLKNLIYSCPPDFAAAAQRAPPDASSRGAAADGASPFIHPVGGVGGCVRFVRGLSLEHGREGCYGDGGGGNGHKGGDGVMELGAMCTPSFARDFYDNDAGDDEGKYSYDDGNVGGGGDSGVGGGETTPRFEYQKFDVADCNDVVTWPGCWRATAAALSWRNFIEQCREIGASTSLPHPSLLGAAKRLMPSLRLDDFDVDSSGDGGGHNGGVVRGDPSRTRAGRMRKSVSRTGVHAIAVNRAGQIVDTLVMRKGDAAVHVLNVPPHGATAALVLADDIVRFAREGDACGGGPPSVGCVAPDGAVEEQCGDGRW